MSIETGITSTSFKVWAVSTVFTVATGVVALLEKKYPVGLGAAGLQVVATFIKTWHDLGLHKALAVTEAKAEKAAEVAAPKVITSVVANPAAATTALATAAEAVTKAIA